MVKKAYLLEPKVTCIEMKKVGQSNKVISYRPITEYIERVWDNSVSLLSKKATVLPLLSD